MNLEFFTDPGHGWLKVPRKLLSDLGQLHKVSRYSYQRGDFVYLEEDCDANLVLSKVGEVKIRHRMAEHRSRILSYESFRLTPLDLMRLYDKHCNAPCQRRMNPDARLSEEQLAELRRVLGELTCAP